MKTRGIFQLVSILLSTLFIMQIGCKEDEPEPENSPPTCEIISPTNDEEITKGTQVTISVEANDSDGGIDEVRFFIDDIGVGTASSLPYNYSWNTTTEELGNHTIKVISEDDDNETAKDEIQVSIVENGGGSGVPCPGMPTITDIDGNVYNTVQIGDQCWMKENLKTTTYNNGTSIPNVNDTVEWINLSTGAYVWYENDITWKDKYGALYNWFATVDPNGLCPTGWHVPTDDEWTALTDFIGGTDPPHGNELKSCRQINSPLGGGCNTAEHPRWSSSDSLFGTNDYGFSALPGHGCNYSGNFFHNLGDFCQFHTSTENASGSNMYRHLWYEYGGVGVLIGSKRNGMAIRCLRD